MSATALDEAFRRLQARDAPGALEAAASIVADEPRNARAYLAAGIALRMLKDWEEARKALERSAALDPRDYAPAFELGMLHEELGRTREALEQYERAAALRPGYLAAHFAAGAQKHRLGDWPGSAACFEAALALDPGHFEARVHLGQALMEQGRGEAALAQLQRAVDARPADAGARYTMGWALDRMGRAPQAFARYEEALARDPRHLEALRALGRHCVRRADYAHAAEFFQAAAALAPDDADLPLYVAQVLLLLGRWREAWVPYARRDSRRAFESRAIADGRPYRVPRLAELTAKDVTLVGEQGLGDILFFLRFAPALRAAAQHLAFAGDRRLHSILRRSGLFDALEDNAGPGEIPVLVADLPVVLDASVEIYAPSPRVPADPGRVHAWRERLAAAGPRPWIAATWRSGTPANVSREALHKSIPLELLFRALAPLGGTVFALQRAVAPGELDAASAALGRQVHDLSHAGDDLEDVLALLACVDRHIGVSSTNMHLAALAGATADVLVTFPPEWRWRPEGPSPWFPGFRLHRQALDGDWSRALAGLAP